MADHGTGTWKGDSGGPLACEKDGQAVIVGANSLGNNPDLFANVLEFLPWIKQNMVNSVLDIKN